MNLAILTGEFGLVTCEKPFEGSMKSVSICVFLPLMLASNVVAALVTTTNDSGPGSLRDIIATASSGDTITFDIALDGQTIILTNGHIKVTNNLTISASALTQITIAGTTNSRVFEIAAGATNAMHSLIITRGVAVGPYSPTNRGGGILNYGTLNVSNCTFSENSAWFGGGIYNYGGILTINNSTLSNNSVVYGGGGIFNNAGGTLTLNNSTVSANSASDWGGGGIYNLSGTVVVNRSTLFSNFTAYRDGGAIFNGDKVMVTNSTFSGNSALGEGGAINSNDRDGGESLTLVNSTISGNSASGSGGGIFKEGTLSIENSIIARNTAPSAANIAGSIDIALGNNLTNGNPMLAPLAHYGGFTRSMPPLPGSAAIDGAVMAADTPPNDQRGAIRPSGPLPDIGSVEAVAFSKLGLEDSDSDGIPDILEGANGPYPQFTVGVNDSAIDTDGDGSSDAEELFNMTDLNNPNDNFRILSFTPSVGFDQATNRVFDVTLKTFPGLGYELLRGNTLTSFESVTNSQISATNFTQTIQVELLSDQDFIRAKRY